MSPTAPAHPSCPPASVQRAICQKLRHDPICSAWGLDGFDPVIGDTLTGVIGNT